MGRTSGRSARPVERATECASLARDASGRSSVADVEAGNAASGGELEAVRRCAVSGKALSADQLLLLRLSEIEEGERRDAQQRRRVLAPVVALLLLVALVLIAVAVGLSVGNNGKGSSTGAGATGAPAAVSVGPIISAGAISIKITQDSMPTANVVAAMTIWKGTGTVESVTPPNASSLPDENATPGQGAVLSALQGGSGGGATGEGSPGTPPGQPAAGNATAAPPSAGQGSQDGQGKNSSAGISDELLQRLAKAVKQPQVKVGRVDFAHVKLSVHGPDPLDWNFDFKEFKAIALNVNGLVNAAVTVTNENAFDIVVDSMTVYAKFYGQDVGSAWVSQFNIPKQSSATIEVPFNFVDFPVVSLSDTNLLAATLFKKKLEFELNIDLNARVQIFRITTPELNVKVGCTAIVDPYSRKAESQDCGDVTITT